MGNFMQQRYARKEKWNLNNYLGKAEQILALGIKSTV